MLAQNANALGIPIGHTQKLRGRAGESLSKALSIAPKGGVLDTVGMAPFFSGQPGIEVSFVLEITLLMPMEQSNIASPKPTVITKSFPHTVANSKITLVSWCVYVTL
jgi:hypothetical protein